MQRKKRRGEKKIGRDKADFRNEIPLIPIDSNYMHIFEKSKLFSCKLFFFHGKIKFFSSKIVVHALKIMCCENNVYSDKSDPIFF